MKKVLCIDDDPAFTEMIADVLSLEGYKVEADSGKKMHDILKQDSSIGLVLMDERLVWTWGSELCKELKENPLTKDIPVAIMSAAKDIELITARCGADAYVRKPFELDSFLATVSQLYQ
ncbi:response regulator [Olivibacter sitiensis]|uniref:response regulator n=1 Tax=Olivibacter sitiensis TaxID=376470 RepID=UPI00040D5367|nr:response regulator [Olivibacter sitiensis]